MADWIPFVSQAKSLVQFISGDSEGARQTQVNFSKQCVLVSQVRSAVEVFTDGHEAARETQLEFVHVLSGVANGIPVCGHAKGIVHYICGDRQGGDDAMKAATRTAGALAGGALGFAAGGPPGAVACGIAGATIVDGITTGVESKLHGQLKANGILKEVSDLVDNPTDAGKWFDTAFTLVADGTTGYLGMKATEELPTAGAFRSFQCKRNALIDNVGKTAAGDLIEAGRRMKQVRNTYKILDNDGNHVISLVKDKKTGKIYEGHNQNIRTLCKKKVNRGEIVLENADRIYDYPGGKKAQTNFQLENPDIERVLPTRKPTSCAEHAAYDQYCKENPHADPHNSWVITAKYNKGGDITAIKRCENCMAFKNRMGAAPGDIVPGFKIPEESGLQPETFVARACKKTECSICGSVLHVTNKSKKNK